MTRKLLAWVLQVALPLAAVFAVTATAVSAHEERATSGFRLDVGWGDEPAYTGLKNSVQVTVSEANGGAPVTDLGDSLEVEVDPSTGQLATRIDREVPRLDTRTAAVESALSEAGNRVNSARTFAIVGMFVGALGLLTAAGALVATRRRSFPDGGSTVKGGMDPGEQTGSRGR